ncbi:MAG: RagB/SusD family nutrient uptake outer membrane protein, partial [Sphingobacteriales bacterium]
ENLNKVHNRAGLPSITVTDQALLRKAIQREWAIEFYYENRRFFDVRHWKLTDIGNGVLGGPMREFQFTITGDALLPSGYVDFYDNVVYSTYWDPKMFLFPMPQEEVDKGVVLQNPGY